MIAGKLVTPSPRRARPRSKKGAPLCFLLALALLTATTLSAQQAATPTDSQVKAAYLYNFGKFVTWPADRTASSPSFEICILGKDPFGEVLDSTIRGESIAGKSITVRRIATIQEAAACSILFISSSEENHLGLIQAAAQRLNLLTVSDIRHFVDRGGTIGFVTLGDRIRFEVNREAARQEHLTLSSELLKVAIRVVEIKVAGN